MRALVFIDLKIDKDEALALLDDYGEFYEEHTGIEPTWYVERRDFSSVPTQADTDGDLKPTVAYRKALETSVHKRYKDYGVDTIIMWVHEDNFLFKGVWGTAWAYSFYKYSFLLCRWDKHNEVNTWNTLFHEDSHPHDTLIKKELGIDINPLIESYFGVKDFDYDRDYVHGQSPLFNYIGRNGYTRDGRMLKLLSPYLQRAYSKRKAKHEQYVTILKVIIKLMQRIIFLRNNQTS